MEEFVSAMNEHELQHEYTTRFRNKGLLYREKCFKLVCYELMFPSWRINQKKIYWGEPSIDFILFDGQHSFLCLEMKFRINTVKDLFKAFCQVTHRASLFKSQYASSKMKESYEVCCAIKDENRNGDKPLIPHPFTFPENPEIIRAIAATKFTDRSGKILEEFGLMNHDSICDHIERYPNDSSKEFNRIRGLDPILISQLDTEVISYSIM